MANNIVLVVDVAGPQGPPGPAGTSYVYIQNSAPTNPPSEYLWIQNGLGASGEDFTFWVTTP